MLTIYQITCKDKSITDCYVGSTTQSIKQRISNHRSSYAYKKIFLYEFMKTNGSFDNFEFKILNQIVHYPDMRFMQEQAYIDLIKPSLNINNAYTDMKEYHKEYREANKETIAARDKKYIEANKETIAAQQKAYKEANREKINARRRAYRESNREKINVKERVYVEANREKTNARRRVSREENREIVNAKERAYREANKEIINARQKARYEANKVKSSQKQE